MRARAADGWAWRSSRAAAGRYDHRLAGLSDAGDNNREEIGGGAGCPRKHETNRVTPLCAQDANGRTPTPCRP